MFKRSQRLSISAELKSDPSKSPPKKKNQRPEQKAPGVRLERKKDASLLNWNLKRPYPPEKIRIPIPAYAQPCIQIGETVQAGQRVAEPQGPKGVSVHAGISGRVERIAVFPSATGGEGTMIEVRREGEAKASTLLEARKGWEEILVKELLGIFQHS